MAQPFTEIYREAQKLAGGACPIEAGILGRLVDHECRHRRLPGDPSPPCGCWPEEGANVIALPANAPTADSAPAKAA